MSVTRTVFNVNGTTTPIGDTGPPIFGALWQMRWVPTTGDTGAELELGVHMRRNQPDKYGNIIPGDTGEGFLFFNREGILGTQFTMAPRQRMYDIGGTEDTGLTPVVLCGESVRMKVRPSQAAIVGRLYMWFID